MDLVIINENDMSNLIKYLYYKTETINGQPGTAIKLLSSCNNEI